MTDRERQDFIRALRMIGISSPQKWDILNRAADELERLTRELAEACERLRYFNKQQLRL